MRWKWVSDSDGEVLFFCLVQNLLKGFHGLHRFWIRFSVLRAVHETSTAAGSKQDDPLISSQNTWQSMPVWSAPLSRCWGFSPSHGSVITKVEVRKRTSGFSGLKLAYRQLWVQTQPSRHGKHEKWNFFILGVIFYYLQCERNKQPQQ